MKLVTIMKTYNLMHCWLVKSWFIFQLVALSLRYKLYGPEITSAQFPLEAGEFMSRAHFISPPPSNLRNYPSSIPPELYPSVKRTISYNIA